MLSIEERQKGIHCTIHAFQSIKERGKDIFLYGNTARKAIEEFTKAIRDQQTGVIVPEQREEEKKSSTHLCLFLSSLGNLIVLPLLIEKQRINILSMYPAKSDKKHAIWFVTRYNSIAKDRNMLQASIVLPIEKHI